MEVRFFVTVIELLGTTLLLWYNGSLYEMLRDLIPNYPWDKNKFANKPKDYFSDSENFKVLIDQSVHPTNL